MTGKWTKRVSLGPSHLHTARHFSRRVCAWLFLLEPFVSPFSWYQKALPSFMFLITSVTFRKFVLQFLSPTFIPILLLCFYWNPSVSASQFASTKVCPKQNIKWSNLHLMQNSYCFKRVLVQRARISKRTTTLGDPQYHKRSCTLSLISNTEV